MNSEHIFDIA